MSDVSDDGLTEVERMVVEMIELFNTHYVAPLKRDLERLTDKLSDLKIDVNSDLIKIQNRLDRLESNPIVAKPHKKAVNKVPSGGLPTSPQDVFKLTCQIFDNRPLTAEMRRKHLTEFVVKLEVQTMDNTEYRSKIETYRPKNFLAHKKKAVVDLSPDVMRFIQQAPHLVGMVMGNPPEGGSVWFQDQVVSLHFNQDRPVVKLRLGDWHLNLDEFHDGSGTQNACKWVATWRNPQARQFESHLESESSTKLEAHCIQRPL